MNVLLFDGIIVDGVGGHSEMVIPGRGLLSNAPEDWPKKLHPGSLNVKVEQWPKGFVAPSGRSGGVYQLDDGEFEPAFTIRGDLISKNKLICDGQPSPAQIWRARLRLSASGKEIDCWVLRRLGSNVGKGALGDVLEIVSHEHIRRTYGVATNAHVTVALTGG